MWSFLDMITGEWFMLFHSFSNFPPKISRKYFYSLKSSFSSIRTTIKNIQCFLFLAYGGEKCFSIPTVCSTLLFSQQFDFHACFLSISYREAGKNKKSILKQAVLKMRANRAHQFVANEMVLSLGDLQKTFILPTSFRSPLPAGRRVKKTRN